MIVLLEKTADRAAVSRRLTGLGLSVTSMSESAEGVLASIGPVSPAIDVGSIRAIPGVRDVAVPASPHPMIDACAGAPVIAGGIAFGGGAPPVVLAGPCSVESETQIHAAATALAALGVGFLRGGAFKPRTSPYAFQGHGATALAWMSAAARATGMRVVTEVLSERDVDLVAKHADLLQVGSRNMQNFALLRAVGATKMPVMLKRGASATIEEWLLAAEWLLASGASGVVLCERGIRGFDPSTRNLLDLGAVALLSIAKGLPVIVDPSHATGRRDLVAALARAGIAAGAAGVMIETHEDPARALSDGAQAVPLSEMAGVLGSLGIAEARRMRGAS